MDLFSLDTAPAQLTRSSSPLNALSKSVDFQKLRNDVQHQDGAVKPLLSDEKVSTLIDSDQDKAKGLSYISIHSSSIFFQSKIDLTQDATSNVQVGKATFSQEDFTRCHDLIQDIRSDLKSKEFLDYDDYAKQALFSNVVADFAKKNLNEEQAQVLNSAMSDYVSSQQLLAQENSAKAGIEDSSFEGIQDYYGKSSAISKDQANFINSSFAKIGLNTNVKAGTQTVVPQATNDDLKNNLTKLFTKLDLNDQDQVNSALTQYKDLLKPVYASLNQGISSSDLDSIVEQKSNDLKKLIQDYRSYTSPSISTYA